MEIQEFKTVLRAFKWLKGEHYQRIDKTMIFVYQQGYSEPVGVITNTDNGNYFAITA